MYPVAILAKSCLGFHLLGQAQVLGGYSHVSLPVEACLSPRGLDLGRYASGHALVRANNGSSGVALLFGAGG